jgi:hypothetical protein
MDINGILDAMRRERDQLEETIMALERLSYAGRKRRGRPPAWLSAARKASGEKPVAKRRGRRPKNSGEE